VRIVVFSYCLLFCLCAARTAQFNQYKKVEPSITTLFPWWGWTPYSKNKGICESFHKWMYLTYNTFHCEHSSSQYSLTIFAKCPVLPSRNRAGNALSQLLTDKHTHCLQLQIYNFFFIYIPQTLSSCRTNKRKE